ncbi:MAG TPA: type II toxin-antitoxin system ParD family antitoxin [Steroidobacteraceae bacterium]|jgi:putative addiction module CopG family antidote|nr:type II toxin-antitoxin system ParD family antitoxin [Steroidobacteraceae bacterium]
MAIDLDRLAPDVRDYINAQVSEGVYSSAEEVLEDAVRRLRQADEERHERLLKALEKGRQGEGIPYSRELMDQIAEDALKAMWSDEPMDPDVVGD